MKARYILLTLVGLSLLSSQAYSATCSKEAAVKKVKEVCEWDIVKNKDKKAISKKANRDKLLYENCGDNYVWIQDAMKGKELIVIMHPIKRKLNNKNQYDLTDKNGQPLFKGFDEKVNAAANGEVWADYGWTKGNSEVPTPKTSFIKKCEGGWIAGSGVWKSDIK